MNLPSTLLLKKIVIYIYSQFIVIRGICTCIITTAMNVCGMKREIIVGLCHIKKTNLKASKYIFSSQCFKGERPSCSVHLLFFTECPGGYFGNNCSSSCPLSRYGDGCSKKCNCSNSLCHHIYGCNNRNGKKN